MYVLSDYHNLFTIPPPPTPYTQMRQLNAVVMGAGTPGKSAAPLVITPAYE